jgi:flagellum-specific peptidoglycan hydrolase FlgJ
MSPQNGGDSKPDRFDLARKMLSGIGGEKKPKPPEGEKKKGESPPAKEGDLLSKLVDAMKDVSGPGGGAAVEPEGYGYLNAVRSGDPIGDWSKWEAIEALQRILPKAGYPLQVTGRWDAQTQSAIKKFQKEKGVTPVTGVFDAPTLAALDKALGLEPEARPEAARAQVASSAPGLPSSGNVFIDGLALGAVKGMLESGVPASVSIAMAVVESGWGEGDLAKKYHNIFAMKGTGPEGSVLLAEGDEGLVPSASGEPYKIYASDAQSVADFAKAFASSGPYQGIMTHKSRPENFARALSGVYSPNPNYGSTVLRIMKQFDLGRFDNVRSL